MSRKMVQFVVGKARAGAALSEFLATSLGISGKKAKSLLDGKHVFVNQGRVWMARHRLAAGDRVEVLTESTPASHEALIPRIVFRDADYLVIDKKPGIVTCGTDGVEGLLRKMPGLSSVVAVHRIDRDTSGCLIMAVDEAAMERLVPLFKRHEIGKEYHAIVRGHVGRNHFTINADVEGERSITNVHLLDAGDVASHVRITIETGRTHQIRRHMASERHPVAGDRQYGVSDEPDQRFRRIGRQMLHASRVTFKNPRTGKMVEARSELPRDFQSCLKDFELR